MAMSRSPERTQQGQPEHAHAGDRFDPSEAGGEADPQHDLADRDQQQAADQAGQQGVFGPMQGAEQARDHHIGKGDRR